MCDLQEVDPTCISMQAVTKSGKKVLCALKLKLVVYGG